MIRVLLVESLNSLQFSDCVDLSASKVAYKLPYFDSELKGCALEEGNGSEQVNNNEKKGSKGTTGPCDILKPMLDLDSGHFLASKVDCKISSFGSDSNYNALEVLKNSDQIFYKDKITLKRFVG
ncbi:hypothetical protein LWI28_016915 [Acer negundo]|uniref:Uncharacterized protein n=1 Tax=Acer negundo TaxID=4023 RepID=A0AAD5IM02_ACENE|nr:hypothetical protein LWI28_016915 [Acer negundo]